MSEEDFKTDARRLAYQTPARIARARRRRELFTVARTWDEGVRYVGLSVRVDRGSFLRSHDQPGQYTTFQFGDLQPRFLVIASAPNIDAKGIGYWDFLIDRDTHIGRHITESRQLLPGRRVILSPAEGGGFPVEKLDGYPALLFCTGSGIAALRPVLQYWRQNPDQAPSSIALYYGEHDMMDFAYNAELPQWREMGVRVHRAVENIGGDSPLDGPGDGIARRFRYVQHAFEADAPALADATALVSGSPLMMEIVIEKLLRMGLDLEHIYTNI